MHLYNHLKIVLIGSALSAASFVHAAVFPLTPTTDVVGEVQLITTNFEDSFITLAKEYNIGFLELAQANPDVDRWVPGEGTQVVLPGRYILPPRDQREGIVINLAELRLYYFPPDGKHVYTYPIGVGRMEEELGLQTPIGKQKVTQKLENAPYYPAASTRKEALSQGRTLPAFIPSGHPDNPMGLYKMRLSNPNYLIHGTNREGGIGRRVSHGCINMFNADIEELYRMTSLNTPVNIVHEPYKVGWKDGYLWAEAHQPLEDYQTAINDYSLNKLIDTVDAINRDKSAMIEWPLVKSTFSHTYGIPAVIGK